MLNEWPWELVFAFSIACCSYNKLLHRPTPPASPTFTVARATTCDPHLSARLGKGNFTSHSLPLQTVPSWYVFLPETWAAWNNIKGIVLLWSFLEASLPLALSLLLSIISLYVSLRFTLLLPLMPAHSHFWRHHLIFPPLLDWKTQRLIGKHHRGTRPGALVHHTACPGVNCYGVLVLASPPSPPSLPPLYTIKQVGAFTGVGPVAGPGRGMAGRVLAPATNGRHWLLVGVSFRPWRMRRMRRQGWLKRRKRQSPRRTRNWANYSTPWITISQRIR